MQVLGELLKRTPMTNAEALGAQVAINNIEKMLGELKSFKNPPPVLPAD